jgi:hypothetical protein
MNDPGRGRQIPLDTSPEAARLQVEIWRRMTPLEKARLVSGLSSAVTQLALAGIRRRYPDASERECRLRLAHRKLGPALYRSAYPNDPIP